jgi:diguanylate cyclase (GGDEF)-like protein
MTMPSTAPLKRGGSATRVTLACALLLLVVTGLRIAVENPVEAVGFLYVVPISIAAVEFGWRGGVATAGAALGLTVFWAVLQDVSLGVAGYAIRAGMFAGLGALLGIQAEQRRALLREREQLIQRLSASAMRDQLTGLGNRRAWDEWLSHELGLARRTGAPLSVGVVDLDGLKQINDSLGHAEGDALIQRFAQRLQAAVRATDFVARLGGDEFFLLLPDCPEMEADDLASRLATAVGTDFAYSLGMATWDGRERGADVVARADAEMYAIKNARVTNERPPDAQCL